MARKIEWDFPLPRTHTGMLQTNGTMGTMVWGAGSVLRITLGRADFWDHRGGLPWTEQQSYANIRQCLEKGDEAGLRTLFEDPGRPPGTPRRPSILPVGRVDVDFGQGVSLHRAALDIDTGEVTVEAGKQGHHHTLRLMLSMDHCVTALNLPPELRLISVHMVPAWEYVGEELDAIGFHPPERFDSGRISGWTQMRPADPCLAVVYRREQDVLLLGTGFGDGAEEARNGVLDQLTRMAGESYPTLQERTAAWWHTYWTDVPKIDIPNSNLRFLYDYGMFKFGGLTQPAGVAATLQGAWVEEYRLPPWSNDYHFNINVQMCYGPAYHGNKLEHLLPLFDLIDGWMPVLRHNARVFLGIEDGLMLPHAVDDRCTCMGGFWTGSIDHGCTAWVAQMMYRYYQYSADREFLEQRAYPFMYGAMRVYEEMLEEEDDVLVLPVSVSPEYRGAAMDAWGRNASFQLACVHRLCADLLEAAEVLGRCPRPIWRRIQEKLPRACLSGGPGRERIALWEGAELEESHRHHSHLAGITPFDIIDLEDAGWWGVIERSLSHWIRLGPGLWSGWCVPWASMIHTRAGNADAAELWLEIWQRVFTNEGHGTLHDVHFPGFSLMGKGAVCTDPGREEIMQIEAGMGCVTAIQEMLLHTRAGVVRLFHGAPRHWTRVGFTRLRAPGGFLLSARRQNGSVGPIEVHSTAAAVLRLDNPWGESAVIERSDGLTHWLGSTLEVSAQANERFIIRPE